MTVLILGGNEKAPFMARPTDHLRWAIRPEDGTFAGVAVKIKRTVLQQLWIVSPAPYFNTEWRDVPTVELTENDQQGSLDL